MQSLENSFLFGGDFRDGERERERDLSVVKARDGHKVFWMNQGLNFN